MTIKVGIIGASFARAAYLPAFKHIEGVEVTSIASFNLENAKSCAEEFKVKNFYDSWEKMLNENVLDLVCIATPTDPTRTNNSKGIKKWRLTFYVKNPLL